MQKTATDVDLIMKDDIRIECIRERDIDLLLLEEWNVNPDFAHWLLRENFNIKEIFDTFDGWHSVNDAILGESDLFLLCSSSKRKLVILLENKIDASAQKDQAERYLKRANRAKQNHKLDDAFVCIAAPSDYLANNSEAAKYANHLSYEQIAEWFAHRDDWRSRYRANIIKMAIEKTRRGYCPVKDEQVTRFWQGYYEILREQLPDAIMKKPSSVPEGSGCPVIKFAHFPKCWNIVHKLAKGCLDIETTLDFEAVEHHCEMLNKIQIQAVQPGKHGGLRITIPPMDRHKNLQEQLPEMNIAIASIRILSECVRMVPPVKNIRNNIRAETGDN